jgi:hypothetical protein
LRKRSCVPWLDQHRAPVQYQEDGFGESQLGGIKRKIGFPSVMR